MGGKHAKGGAEGDRPSVYGEKFRLMLELVAHPDGGAWTGAKMERATEGKIAPSYFSTLREGRIEVPRVDKVEAIARAMGFPPELWFKDLSWWRTLRERWEGGEDVAGALRQGREQEGGDGIRLTERLNRLFEIVVNERTGERFTNREVAELSRGTLREEDVAAMREGRLADPTWAQVLALCNAFEVEPSYWSERGYSWQPSAEVLKGVEDQDSYVVFRNSLNLSRSNRSMLRILSEHLRREESGGEGELR